MKQLLLSTVAVCAIGGSVQAQDAAALQGMIDAGIAQLNSEGANITFDSKEIGDDNAITYRGLRIAPDDTVITTEFLTISPSADVLGDVTATMAPLLTITAAPNSETDPIVINIATEGFAFSTNWMQAMAGNPVGSVMADLISITDGSDTDALISALDVELTGFVTKVDGNLATRSGTASQSFSSLKMDYAITDPSNGTFVKSTADVGELLFSFEGTNLPIDESMADDFLANGAMDIVVKTGPGQSSFESDDPDMAVTLTSTAEAGQLSIAMRDGNLAVDSVSGKVAYSIIPDPSVLPLPPFDVSLDGLEMALAMPLAPSPDPRDVKLGLLIDNLALSDTLWGMIDPVGAVPRDPASLVLEILADLTLSVPFSEMEDAPNPMALGEVRSVTLSKLSLEAAGVSVAAEGGATIDNSGPFPMPTGAIDVTLIGIQGLGQSLVELGIVPAAQMGMAMGMMMAFAKAGDAPDTFTSKLEFKDGEIFANGMSIQ